MEGRENSGATSSGAYNKLINQDLSLDEQPLYTDHDNTDNTEKQQVSMSMPRPESRLNHYKRLAVSLAVLAAILLAVDIGLGVYYNQLSGGQRTITDISGELAKLQDAYNIAVQRRDDLKKELAKTLSDQQLTKWQLEHQSRRSKDYQKDTEKFRMEIAGLKAKKPMIEESCRHCLPGWTFMISACYYFPFSDVMHRRPWQEARDFCRKHGADLAVVNTTAKHLAISEVVKNNEDPTRLIAHTGYWMGLRDVGEEGIWKWLNGQRLVEGYWNDGEPNNQGNEDCAAVYPRSNPFKAWNDAPCSFDLKWICEMAPKGL